MSPTLLRRVLDTFPDAWIEDPALTEETLPLLEPDSHRITWDAPIHSVADIEALPFPPRMVNLKPSRLGSLTSVQLKKVFPGPASWNPMQVVKLEPCSA